MQAYEVRLSYDETKVTLNATSLRDAIAAALIGYVVTRFADDTQIRTITFWTLGSLAGANWQSALLVAALTLLGGLWVLSQWRSITVGGATVGGTRAGPRMSGTWRGLGWAPRPAVRG